MKRVVDRIPHIFRKDCLRTGKGDIGRWVSKNMFGEAQRLPGRG